MAIYTPVNDFYDFNGSFIPSVGSTARNGKKWENEVACLLRLIVAATPVVPYDTDFATVGGSTLRTASIIGDEAGNRVSTVLRPDGVRALCVDTEISIDAATFNINNLFTASTDNAPTGARYMWLESIDSSQESVAGGGDTAGLVTKSLTFLWQAAGSVHVEAETDFGSKLTAMRVAALIGNTFGVADFDVGAVTPQTIRVVLETLNRTNITTISTEILKHLSALFTTGAGTIAVGAVSTPILAANALRKTATIVNDSVQPVYLAIGTVAVANAGIRLNASGGSYTVDWQNLHGLAINGIRAIAGSSNVTVVEGV